MSDYIVSREDRLGTVFNKDNLIKLNNLLNDLELPHIPYNITLDEMQMLLAYHGNMLAYLHANLEVVNLAEIKQIAKQKEIYNIVYNDIQKTSTENKVTTLKNITSKNKRVLEEERKLLDIKTTQSKITASINALTEQSISLRKIANVKSVAIENSLE